MAGDKFGFASVSNGTLWRNGNVLIDSQVEVILYPSVDRSSRRLVWQVMKAVSGSELGEGRMNQARETTYHAVSVQNNFNEVAEFVLIEIKW